MKYKLYLDDLRAPRTPGPWKCARSFKDAIMLVQIYGLPTYCSFDHDLGRGETGYDFAKWMVEYELDGNGRFPDDFDFNIHSANPVGAKAIKQYLTNYFAVRVAK